MNNKKILLVVANNLMHGTERYVIDLAKHLSNEKFIVTVAVPEKGPLSDILHQNNINEFVYFNGKFNKFSIKGSYNIFKYLRKNRYDVIHSNCGIIPNIIGKILGVKLNIEIKHGILIADEVLENMTMGNKFHEKIKQYFVDYFIAISQNDKEKMIKYFDIKENKIKVIYNGVDTENIIPYNKKLDYESESKKESLLIGTIGRFTYQKAQDILIHSFKIVLSEYPNMKLMIMGVGEDRKNIEKLICTENLQDKIILEDYKINVYDFIRKFDIFILTSRFEGVPYVILEAMNIGTPIISTRVGGIDNILTDGYSALLVEKGNVGKISNALIRLINNPMLRINLSNNAFAEVKKYSIEKMSKNVEDLYLENLN
jgi:glycosyltransferase involved in cell wall biosynthesis